MKTKVAGSGTTVTIDRSDRVILIGERINPTPNSNLAQSLSDGKMNLVRHLANEQVDNGADLLDLNVDSLDDRVTEILPEVVDIVTEEVDVPIVIDTNHDNVEALELALEICPGKPVINSVSGQDESMNQILPLVSEYQTAVIGLTLDDDGIPDNAERRLTIAENIISRAENVGIPKEDVIIDPVSLPISVNPESGLTTLRAIELITETLGNNISLGVSNVSFEMPRRTEINNVFLSMAIKAGLNAPIVNPSTAAEPIKIADMLVGRDEYATRFLEFYRSNHESNSK